MASMSNNERDKMYLPIFAVSVILLFVAIYWFGRPLFVHYEINIPYIDEILFRIYAQGKLHYSYAIKFWILAFVVLNVIVKAGKPTKLPWKTILIVLGVGLLLFFWPFRFAPFYIAGTLIGYLLIANAVALVGRKVRGMKVPFSKKETFEQCTEKIANDDSFNFQTKFRWQKKYHTGWINVVNPFRGILICGTPGSGKSFSVYNQIIEQMAQKAYTAFVYDYKFPDLTEEMYNRYLQNQENYKKKMKGKVPKFCVINFDDPRYSLRCNPIHPRYLKEPVDASEIADIIMRNVNPQSIEKEDFFTLSAKVFIDALVWYLRNYKDGIYCTFPHLIELLGRNYKAVFKILMKYDDTRVKIQPFQNALLGNAQEQLQGQIASAQIPLMRFASPSLYWVLSGDDFSLDINSKDDPKILCIGNNPGRQTLYGTTLALFTSRMFRQINVPGKYPCGVLFDEFPTIYVKGIHETIATARSNKVVVVLGAQDLSQMVLNYGQKEADVIYNIIGNLICGQVNGSTAKRLSEMCGKEDREQESETISDSGESINRSYHQVELLSQATIETFSQGFFCGKVADNNDQKIDLKLFCAEVVIDMQKRKEFKEGWKKLEPVGAQHFDDEGVEREVRREADVYIRKIITERLREEEKQKSNSNPKYTAYSPDSIDEIEEVERRFAELTDKNRETLLDAIIKEEQRRDVDRILRENYVKIKNDILSIFEDEGVPEFEENEQGDGAQQGGSDSSENDGNQGGQQQQSADPTKGPLPTNLDGTSGLAELGANNPAPEVQGNRGGQQSGNASGSGNNQKEFKDPLVPEGAGTVGGVNVNDPIFNEDDSAKTKNLFEEYDI